MVKLLASMLVVAAVAAAPGSAHAQVCSSPVSGVAEIRLTTSATTIKMVSGVPKANTVSCGFAATTLVVVGQPGKDAVTFTDVPPQVGVFTQLGGGGDTVKLFASAGNDTIVCAATGLDRNGDGTVDLTFDTPPTLTIYGQAGDDVIDCAAYPIKATIYGKDGDDTIDGTGFNDVLDGGTGDDTIRGGAGNDTIQGGDGTDDLAGDAGNDTFKARATFDGNDALAGGPGTDTANYTARAAGVAVGGPSSEDTLGDDVETIRGGKGADVVDGSAATGPRTIYGGAGNDAIRGGAFADKLYGDAGSDAVIGGGGKDAVDGGDGDDVLDAGRDDIKETIKCGTGRDWYPAVTSFNAVMADVYTGCEHVLGQRLAATADGACAILLDGRLRCWGAGSYGQLGTGDINHRGDAPGEMGAALPVVDLGTTASGAARTATAIAGGYQHFCALLSDGAVKCWGLNNNGQLGLGDTANRGDAPGEMGNALPAVDLGTGRSAIAISAAMYFSCALLDNGQVKCWGWGQHGALGQGDPSARGNAPGEMGNALPAIALGTGRTATAIQAYENYACAILDDRSTRCWGANNVGQLGLGDAIDRGDAPGQMGDALPALDFGPGRSAIRLAAYDGGQALEGVYSHACAVLDDATVKCWGFGGGGVLGTGDAAAYGDEPGEMGDRLPVLDLGGDRIAAEVAVGSWNTCAVLADGAVKCFGLNALGTLGQGDTATRGDDPGELGNALPPILLGAGRTATDVVVGDHHVCVGLDDRTVKCWGHAWAGIGLGNTNAVGDKPDQMGDALPAVQLGGVLALTAVADANEAEPELAPDVDVSAAEAIGGDGDGDDSVDDDASAGDSAPGGCAAAGGRGGPTLAALVLAIAASVRRRRRS